MPDATYDLHGFLIFECGTDGKLLKTERDATDVLSSAWSAKATLALIPAVRFEGEFFRLSTQLAGAFIQKFVTYGMRLAILGDISSYVNQSKALHDFVYECNCGTRVWFIADRDELRDRLRQLVPAADRK